MKILVTGAAGFVAVLNNPDKVIGEIFNIGSDNEITTAQGIAIVEEIMGTKARFEMKAKRPGDQLHTRANIDKARRILGYEPQASLENALRLQVKWYTEKIFEARLQDS